jgi:hypothetical protein
MATPLAVTAPAIEGISYDVDVMFKSGYALVAKGRGPLTATVPDIDSRFVLVGAPAKPLTEASFTKLEQYISKVTKVDKKQVSTVCFNNNLDPEANTTSSWSAADAKAQRRLLLAVVAHVLASLAVDGKPPGFWKASGITLPVPGAEPDSSAADADSGDTRTLAENTTATARLKALTALNVERALALEERKAAQLAEMERAVSVPPATTIEPPTTQPDDVQRTHAALQRAIAIERSAFDELTTSLATDVDATATSAKRKRADDAALTVRSLRARVRDLQPIVVDVATNPLQPLLSEPAGAPAASAAAKAQRQAQTVNQQQLLQSGTLVDGRINLNHWAPQNSVGSPLSSSLTTKIAAGQFDINFSLLLKNRRDAEPGILRLEDPVVVSSRRDWTWQAWEVAFDLFARCLTTQWEGMSAQMQLYKSDVKLLHDRYRKSHPQGFALYDQHFRSLAAQAWTLSSVHVDWKTRHNDSFSIVFTGHLVSLCAICDAFDHVTRNCPTASGPNPQRALKSPGAVATGLDGLVPKKVTYCHKFNAGKTCLFSSKGRPCKYAHRCSTCDKEHAATNCTAP